MNKGQLLDLISNPILISKSDAEGLKQVIQAYPYFTAANYLLAKFYHEQDDFQYQQQLKVTATQTNNRASLYQLIHENVPTRESIDKVIITADEPEQLSTTSEIEKKEIVGIVTKKDDEVESSSNSEPITSVKEIVGQVLETEKKLSIENEEGASLTAEGTNPSDITTNERIKITDEKETETESNANDSEEESSISALAELNNAVQNTIDHDEKEFHESEDNDLALDDEQDKLIESEVEGEHVQTELSNAESATANTSITDILKKKTERDFEKSIDELIHVVESNPLKHNVDLNIITRVIETNLDMRTVAAHPIVDDGNEHSFIYWLKRTSVETVSTIDSTSAENLSLQKLGMQVANEETFDSSHNPSLSAPEIGSVQFDSVKNEKTNEPVAGKKTSSENNNAKLDKSKALEILDKFIETQPKMSKPKVDFYSPINMAKQSVADHDELATETLATIYMAQGNYVKAIKVYESLTTKYPEKESYFTKLIKKAKDRMQPRK